MAIPPRIKGIRNFFQFLKGIPAPETAWNEERKEFSMESIKIRFGNADEVWKFVNTIRRFNGEYDLAAGSYTVDAKSILGVCALGTGKALDLKLVNPKGEEQQLLTALHEYLVSK